MKQTAEKIRMILLGTLLCLTGCSSPEHTSRHASSSSVNEFTQKYVLTAFYGNEEDRNAFLNEKKKEGVLHNISWDQSSGSITVTASLTQAQYWVQEAENEIEQNAVSIQKDDGYSLAVNASDTEITITASPDSDLKAMEKTVNRDLMAMEIHQVFSGISSWHVDVNVINADTNASVKTFSLPEEQPQFDESIWK